MKKTGDKMTEKDFARRVAQLREAKGASAREMSVAIGQNPGYISNIETGKALPSLSGILAICRYLELTPAEFFDLDLKDPKKTDELFRELKGLDSRYVDVIKTLVVMLKEKSDY